MKLTVITNKLGKVIGTVRGHANDLQVGEFKAGLVIQKGEKHHEIEVPDTFLKMEAKELHKNVVPYLKKSK